MNKPIRKAVLPVAGLVTRFLPVTKAIPKDKLTIVDRPILQLVDAIHPHSRHQRDDSEFEVSKSAS
jgi:hypothetical protein